jgi:osmotically-inducible protein OsmY
VAGGRSAEDIQREIERSRAELAEAVDQLAYRTNPKRLVEQAKQALRDRANSPQGRIVIGVSGGVVVVLVGLRIRKAVSNHHRAKLSG